MNHTKPPAGSDLDKKYRRLVWLFSILAAVNCLLVAIFFSITQNSNSSVDILSQWPFPLIYFIEIAFLSLIGLISVGKIHWHVPSNWSGIPWICSGILLAFVILGAWTIGFFLLPAMILFLVVGILGAWTIGFFLIPAMILFLVVGILADKRTQGDIPLHLIFFVAAGIAQAALVFMTLIG